MTSTGRRRMCRERHVCGDGNVIDEFVDPPMVKGSSGRHERSDKLVPFTITESFEDPELGPLTFSGEGSLTVFVTPVR